MTAMEMIDDENFLGADGRHIFICQKNRSDRFVSPWLPCGISSISFFSEVAVESDLMYMLQPSRMYIGDNINVFHHGNATLTHVRTYVCVCFAGSLVTEHPGTSPSPIQGKPILYGSVHGAVGMATHTYHLYI